MNKLLITILFFGLGSCNNQKTEQATTSQTLSPNSSSGSENPVPIKVDYASIFGANSVVDMGKAINCIFQDSQGNYWFGTNSEGALCYDGKKLFQFTTKDGLADNQVFTIQEDMNSNIWFLTVAGISRLDVVDSLRTIGKSFTTFPGEKDKESFNDFDLTRQSNCLWFEVAGGAYRYNGKLFSYLLLPNTGLHAELLNPTNSRNPDARKLNRFSVYCSLKDRNGNVWFGTQTEGVCLYDSKNFTWFTEKGLAGPAVRALFEDRNGNMWFGNNGNGLFRYDGKTLTNFSEENGLNNPAFLKSGKSGPGTMARVWAVNEDNDGNIWIGTYDAGLWRYNPSIPVGNNGKRLTNYTIKDGLSSNAINTIYKDSNGELWIGTDGAGVCKFNGSTFSVFTIGF